MKKSVKILLILAMLCLCSCSAKHPQITEPIETDIPNIIEMDIPETTAPTQKADLRDGILADDVLYEEFSAMVFEKTGLEITDEALSFTYEYNSDSRYPHIFTASRRTDGMNFVLEFNICSEEDSMHIGERNTDIMYYGERAEGDRLITLDDAKPSMFRLRLEEVLAEQFGENVQLLVTGIIQFDTSLGIPIMAGTDFYFVDTGILRENNREDYKITGYEKVDLNAVTPYEFFIKYNAFGLEPLEFCKYNSVFGKKLNSALTEKFGQEFSFDNYDYMVSEFFPKTFIRLRNETTNTWIHLYNEKIEKSFAPADVTEDTVWDDLRMIVGAPSRRTDYSKAGNLFLPIINYMNVLTDYVHEPYQMGDSLVDNNILFLFSLLCSCMDPDAPVYADFTVDDTVITITKSELERLAECLFGDNFDLTEHHSTLNGKINGYDPDTDSYTFFRGTDYRGDNITIDYDSVVITEEDDTVTVEVSLGLYPSMGDPADPDSFKDYVYHFEKVESRGIGYLKLISITELMK